MSTSEPTIPGGWPGAEVPNFSDWREGDFVLVHSSGDIPGVAIQSYQAVSANPLTRAGSICTHVGIYVGDGMVVDTMPGVGVTMKSVWNYCQTRAIQLKRMDPNVFSVAQTAIIATTAKKHIGEPYSVVQAAVSVIFPDTKPVASALYCSTFVGLVVAQATGYLLYGDPAHQPLQPGTLAAHLDLIDIDLEWRQL